MGYVERTDAEIAAALANNLERECTAMGFGSDEPFLKIEEYIFTLGQVMADLRAFDAEPEQTPEALQLRQVNVMAVATTRMHARAHAADPLVLLGEEPA